MPNDPVELDATAGPKYKRACAYLRRQIHEGRWKNGEKLPSESDLMAMFSVSRHTVRQSIQTLEAEGLVRTEHGRGSFVTLLPQNVRRRERNASGLIGVLARDLGASLIGAAVEGAERVMSRQGRSMLLSAYNPLDSADEYRGLTDLVRRDVDGVIAFPSFDSDLRRYAFITEAGLPLVMVDNPASGVNADAVTADSLGGATAGTQALLAAGCRTLGFLSGYLSAWTSRERLTGFRRALWDAGIPEDTALMLDGPFSSDFGAEAIRRLLERQPALDGVFVANHPIANGVVRTLLQTRSHAALRVATFDEIDSALGEFFPLVSVRQSPREIGEKAAELLVERMDHKRRGEPSPPARHVTVPAVLHYPPSWPAR